MIGYTYHMILGFRHKGLELLFEKGSRKRVPPTLAPKIGRILARLDEAAIHKDMNLPGFDLHPLKDRLAGYWAVKVSGNWRIIFHFQGRNAKDVDLVDYH